MGDARRAPAAVARASTAPSTVSGTFDVGSDVGGTFTDLWLRSSDGRRAMAKVPTTPDIVSGIVDGLHLCADQLALSTENLCRGVRRFGHGTTIGLNALLTGTPASVALITTSGFRDTIEIGRLKRQLAGLSETEVADFTNRGRHRPIVGRDHVVEVVERVDREGTVVVPLEEQELKKAVDAIVEFGVDAVAVCTLWSVVNPSHEQMIAAAVRDRCPGLFVCTSHEVAGTVGEYARASTTVANALLGPVMGRYLADLEARLRSAGLRIPVHIMTGLGGVADAERVGEEPVAALLSGPAACIMAAHEVGRRAGHDQLLSIDVGGTSFDVGLVVDGAPLVRGDISIGGIDIHRPSVDVATIGAGGGSIARVRDGVLTVGPDSSGAMPGPACYGRGGREPTATDADLVLGTLVTVRFASGDLVLSPSAAEQAIERRICEPLGLSLMGAAWGIRKVLDSNMADVLRRVTIERGHDPRQFLLVANGGMGPSHAWALCADLGIPRFLVAPTATVQSAVGAATLDLRASAERTCFVRVSPGDGLDPEALDRVDAALRATLDRALAKVAGARRGRWSCLRFVAVRYRGQAHAIDVPIGSGFGVPRPCTPDILARFEEEHETLFGAGSRSRHAGFEVLSVRSDVLVRLGRGDAGAGAAPMGDELERLGTRPVVFDDPSSPCHCPVWSTSHPAPDQVVEGPCLVAYRGQTLVVPPGAVGRTDGHGNILVTLALAEPEADGAAA
ncbi:MAG: hydantoinase/oxoprolinase family protein [Acidimicrobiales bacterium]